MVGGVLSEAIGVKPVHQSAILSPIAANRPTTDFHRNIDRNLRLAIIGSLDLKQRFAFEHRAGVGEGVEGPNFYVVDERLNVDVADGSEIQTPIGFKSVHQSGGLRMFGLVA